MERVLAALSEPDFWNKPHSGGGIGLVVGGVVGYGLSLYFVRASKYSYYGGQLRSMLIWMPCMLLGILIGELIVVWMGR
jgi:hypothetical protein